MIGDAMTNDQLVGAGSAIPGGVGEVKRWMFYDDTIVAGGANWLGAYAFFQTPLGSGGKAQINTNFRGNGILPAGQWFEVRKLGVALKFTVVSIVDVATTLVAAAIFFNAMLYEGFLTIVSGGSKTELELPNLAAAPCGGGAAGLANLNTFPVAAPAAGGGLYEPTNGVPAAVNMFDFGNCPIVLSPNRNFVVTITYPVAVAVAAGFTSSKIVVYLDGYLHRPA